jgi:hypothetical protein
MPKPPTRPRIDRDNFVASWLRSQLEPKYTSFVCTVLTEIAGSRPQVESALTEAVFVHHNDPETFRQKLAHLGFPATAAALDRRPRSVKTRLGNFGEVLASEFLRQIRGYRIPVYRLRYNCNDESSPKGRQFYQLGLPLRDCEFIEGERDTLLALYQRAVDYGTWTITERAAHLDEISGVLFRLSEVAPDVEVPVCARRILEL